MLMRTHLPGLVVLAIIAGCGEPLIAPDAGPDAGSDAGAPLRCEPILPSGFVVPSVLDPSGVSEGRIDPSVEHDPTTGRTWLVYSGVVGGPFVGRPFRISQRLAYSDDGGASWCDHSVLVPVENIADAECPPTTTAPCHFNQETGRLVYVPWAPPALRWKHFWFMVAATPENNYAFALYYVREASTPEGLATAPMRRLFGGGAYAMPSIGAWLDGHPVSLPAAEVLLHKVDPTLAGCVQFAEMGALSTNDTLLVSFLCARTGPPGSTIVLLASDDPTLRTWSYRGALVDDADAQRIDPTSLGYSASDLFVGTDGVMRVVVSPTLTTGGQYKGCDVYQIVDPLTARVSKPPERVLPAPAGTPHFGMCTYHAALTGSGMIAAQVFADAPYIRLSATGLVSP